MPAVAIEINDISLLLGAIWVKCSFDGLREVGDYLFNIRPDNPVTTLTGDKLGVDFHGRDDMPALRDAARAWFRQKLLYTMAMTKDGRKVRFNDRGLKKIVSKGPDMIRALPAVRDIIEKGDLIETPPGDGKGTIAIHLYDRARRDRRLGAAARRVPARDAGGTSAI